MLKIMLFGLLFCSFSIAQAGSRSVELTRAEEQAQNQIGYNRLIISFDNQGIGKVYDDLGREIALRSIESFNCKTLQGQKTIIGSGVTGAFATDVRGRAYYIDKNNSDLLDTSRCIPK